MIDIVVDESSIDVTAESEPVTITLAAPIDVRLSGDIDVTVSTEPIAIIVDDSISVVA